MRTVEYDCAAIRQEIAAEIVTTSVVDIAADVTLRRQTLKRDAYGALSPRAGEPADDWRVGRDLEFPPEEPGANC